MTTEIKDAEVKEMDIWNFIPNNSKISIFHPLTCFDLNDLPQWPKKAIFVEIRYEISEKFKG